MILVKQLSCLLMFLTICLETFGQNTKQIYSDLSRYTTKQSKQMKANEGGFQLYYLTKEHNGFSFSAGFSDSIRHINSSTIFNIGSTSKTFTAYIILDLIEKGVLDLETPLTKHLKFKTEIDKDISIRQALNHTSGIEDFLKDTLINHYIMSDTVILSEKNILSSLHQNESKTFNYSNSNYFLLSKVIENRLDKPYQLVLEDYIHHLGLSNTYAVTGRYIQDLAHPFHSGFDLCQLIDFEYYSVYCKGAGAMASNSKDMAYFFNNLLSKTRASNIGKTQLKSTQNDSDFGFGLEKTSMDGHIFYGHPGDNVGYSSRVFHSEEHDYTLVVLFNNSDYPYIKNVSTELLQILIKNHKVQQNK
ncbi:MAG: serine hydrolase domain-containing protein [Flavobacteriales bacterium]